MAAVAPARRAAYEVVLRVFEEDAYADRVFRTVAAKLDERDRALAQQLAYGTVQRVRTLDHAIETLARRKVHRLDAPVRAALRLGGYQLAFMGGIARYAAVNESVELVRGARLERAVPFTNAVLRRLTVGIRELIESLPEGALKLSYPDWVEEAWTRDLGREVALALMRAQNEPPELVVRRNRRKAGEIEGDPDPELPDAVHVRRLDEAAVEAGVVWPQSRGSQLAGLCVGSREGERVLDLCAAPGGKATQLAGGRRRGEASRAGARARGDLRADGRHERDGRMCGRLGVARRADRVRPRARGRPVLRARCAGGASRSALAGAPVA